jgi:hypothetical protein
LCRFRNADDALERLLQSFRVFIDLDLAGHIDEAFELLGIIGLVLRFAGHGAMIARRTGESFFNSDRLADVVMHTNLADGDVPGPSIKPIDDASSCADLPAERDQNCRRYQDTHYYDGKSNSHRAGIIILGDDPALIAALNEACEDLRHRRCTEGTLVALAALQAARDRAPLSDQDADFPVNLPTLRRRMGVHRQKSDPILR